ncbi:ABC transporter substrate-binding protein [Variovorax sp. 770b2]|uniref:ABC transporter substrate-binding protein n=1 Tax=Variovorax sp. 770b2 TaxID=1566271 RepID=UPI0008EF21DE|nr:ABC transporter substrate-binding protein [Variovorax sp. 770b2]SFQ05444.1 ABC-type branched-chain amino acid transport system, substrate-binding protein [Variovorax sp. 770b2]
MKRRIVVCALGGASVFGIPAIGRSALKEPRELVIGQSAISSGIVGAQVRTFNQGAGLAIAAANEGHGINGQKIRLVSLDDEFNPAKTVANTEILLREHRVSALFGYIGTSNVLAVDKLLRNAGVPLMAVPAITDVAREQTAGSSYYIRATSQQEAAKIVSHLSVLGLHRIAVAHFASPGGEEFKTAVVAKLAELGIEPVRVAALKMNGSNTSEAAEGLAKALPQALVLYAAGVVPAALISEMEKQKSYPAFYGMSFVSAEATAEALQGRLRGLVVSQIVPYPWAVADPAIEQFRKRANAAGVPVNYTTMEGYVSAAVLMEALRRTTSNAPGAVHAAIKTLKGTIAGLPVDFTGASNTGTNFVDLTHISATGRISR